MYRNFVRDNVTLVSIVLFISIFSAIQLSKPAFLYNTDGSIREFGVGYKNKTILPYPWQDDGEFYPEYKEFLISYGYKN